MNLVLLAPNDLDAESVAHLEGDRARHLRTVLAVTPGQSVRVGLIDGPAGVGVVRAVSDAAIDLLCAFDPDPPARPVVDLLLAMPRPKVLRRLWAQVAALGVGRIILTNAARVERNYFDTHWLARATYEPLLIEGLQQARDTRLPLVSVHRQFKILIEDELDLLCPTGLRLVAHPFAEAGLADSVNGRQHERVLLAIGPEGGWNDFEMGCLADHGFVVASMGLRTLRTDTACVAALSLVHAALQRCPSTSASDAGPGLR